MHAEELIVHNGRQRQRIERLDAKVIQCRVVLVDACKRHRSAREKNTCVRRERALCGRRTKVSRTLLLKGEVGREVAALVVATDHPEGLREVHLESVHVEEHLHREGACPS